MPKQTFFNLPENKRKLIIQSALEEFAENLYLNASITKIAENANVAKGSMYQYFHNKKDLYKYILKSIVYKKMVFLEESINHQNESSFIETVRTLYKKGLEFAIENPLMASIANNFIKEKNSDVKEEILKESQGKSNYIFINLIERAKNRGEISPDINAEMAAYIIYHFNNALLDMLMNSREYSEILENYDEYMQRVDDLLLILEKGLIIDKTKR